jgi:hypothetical protein
VIGPNQTRPVLIGNFIGLITNHHGPITVEQ